MANEIVKRGGVALNPFREKWALLDVSNMSDV